MHTPFKILELHQDQPYTTIQLHTNVDKKSLLKLYNKSSDGTEISIPEELWTINTHFGENTEIQFLQEFTSDGILYIDIYPPEFLSDNVPLNIDPRSPLQTVTISKSLETTRAGLRAVAEKQESIDYHVKHVLPGHEEIQILEQKIAALAQEIEDFKNSHSQDIRPNPDNPPSQNIQNLLDKIQEFKTRLDQEVSLSEQERADLVSLKAELEHKLPNAGDALSPEHIQEIIKSLVEHGKIIDHAEAFKLLDHAFQTRLARITLGDGSARNTKSLLDGHTKPQFLVNEKDLPPDPETLQPTQIEMTLGQIGLVPEQILLNKLTGGGSFSLNEDERNLILKHDPGASGWAKPAGAILDSYDKARYLHIIYNIPGHGKRTALNLSGLHGDVANGATLSHLYGIFESDKTVQQFNKDGSEKIVDGNYPQQKVFIEARVNGDQLAEIFKDSTFGQNIIKFMKALSQPKTYAEKSLPINEANTPATVINTLTDLHAVKSSYHHIYDMRPDLISFTDGIVIVPSDDFLSVVVGGTSTKARIKGYLAKVITEQNQEIVAEMSADAAAVEDNIVNAHNVSLQQDYHKQESVKKLDLLNFISGQDRTYRYMSDADRITFLTDLCTNLVVWLRHSTINEDNQVRNLKNPQVREANPTFVAHPETVADRYEAASSEISQLISE